MLFLLYVLYQARCLDRLTLVRLATGLALRNRSSTKDGEILAFGEGADFIEHDDKTLAGLAIAKLGQIDGTRGDFLAQKGVAALDTGTNEESQRAKVAGASQLTKKLTTGGGNIEISVGHLFFLSPADRLGTIQLYHRLAAFTRFWRLF